MRRPDLTAWSTRFLLAYGVLLIASFLVRAWTPPPSPRPDQRVVSLAAVRPDGTSAAVDVSMAYADSDGPGPVVVLLHGSPAASVSVMALHRRLASRGYRVLTPDLPGFGRSTEQIPSYSIRAHGGYLNAWLDSLQVSEVDILGYSMGGGVALEAYEQNPSRVRSLMLLSSIGVQELELTGDYYLNHAIHGLQLGALWLVRVAIPHFGIFDHVMLGVPYARNFFETDQRPLRGILRDFQPPALIIHGKDDAFVPYAAALEHRRLVPQSTLVTLDGGHGLPFVQSDTLAAIADRFVQIVALGTAPDRTQAAPARIASANQPFDPGAIPRPSGFAIALLMLLVAMATMVSEDLASIGAGLMAARGTLTFPEATLAALGGIVIGDVGLYLAGRWLGRPMVRRAPFRWFLSAEMLARGEQWFHEKGIRAVLVARFVPGTRLPTYLAAGVLKAPFGKFMGYFFLAALMWAPAVVGGAMVLGQSVLSYYASFERYAIWVVLALAAVLLLAFRVLPELFTHAGRRRLRGRWIRLTTWEFWPPWAFYPPVVLYALWLSLKYRGLFTFTAANPGIPDGGLVGESKQAILSRLQPEHVATFALLQPAETADALLSNVREFMARNALSYPVVLKPDVGERGLGVAVVRSDQQVSDYWTRGATPTVVQRYITGREYGVFYYRDPDTGRGTIFSVTEKTFPAVTGDGQRTLQRLILDDSRAVAMHATYERIRMRDLHTVPAPGEQVPLVELGTHSRGSVFLDGSRLITPALTQAMEAIARPFSDFHFGRFDLRAPGPDSLMEGLDLTVLELNGVTSEATHIYHPGFPLLKAWRTLFQQWELAYRIGAANRKQGAAVSSPGHIFGLLAAHLQRVSNPETPLP